MEMIKNTILCRDVLIRNGVRKLFECSSSCKIPIIIVSAGLGDIVKGFIEKEIGHFENINYMANIFKFNEKGFVAGFQYEMIHSYNKNLYPTIMKKYIDDNRSRKNIILLGDMVSDLNIVENLRESFNILSLGFINEKYEERVINYSKSFDICINNPNELIITNLLLKLFSSV